MKKKVKKGNKSKSVYSKSRSFFSKREKQHHICDPTVCHNVDQTNYCFYQTSQTIKIYVTIPGVENLSKSKIKIRFQEKSFELSIYDLVNANYHLIFDSLLYRIIPTRCRYVTRKDKIILELAKETHKMWKTLEEIVSQDEWIQAYCECLEDIPEFGDASALYGFAEGMWDQLFKFQDKDFNYLKPPIKMQEFIPALRKHPSFKSLDVAIAFYKGQLRKDRFNEALYIILGGSILEKQRSDKLEKLALKKPENIEESIFKISKTAATVHKRDSKGGNQTEIEAESRKAEGNTYYKTGRFYAALQMYLEAIELWPENAFFYSNASASYMMLGMYTEALSMAQKSVKIDSSFSKGYLRIGKCNLALGNTKAALKTLTKAKELGESSEEVESEISRVNKLLEYLREGKAAAGAKNYGLAATHYNSACSIAIASPSLLFLRVEYLILCEKFLKAKGIAKNLLEQNVEDANAHCILGMVAYHQDDKGEMQQEFDAALKITRNHAKTKAVMDTARALYDKKERGNEAFTQKKYQDALKLFRAGLVVDPKNKVLTAKLHYNIATVMVQLNDLDAAIQSLTAAIDTKSDYAKAYVKRASLYQDTSHMCKAIRDLREAVRIAPTDANKKLLRAAESIHNRKKDYYSILKVPRTASEEEVKNAYKKLALLHHPDRHEDPKSKEANEKIFQEVSEAYSVLKDPRHRQRYNHTLDYMDDDDDYSDDDDDDSELDEFDLMKIFLISQFMNRHNNMNPFFPDDCDDYSDTYDEDDTEYDSDYDYFDEDDDDSYNSSELDVMFS